MDRRSFLNQAICVAIPPAQMALPFVLPAAGTRAPRPSVFELALRPAELARYRLAVERMRTLPAGDPRSLAAQANLYCHRPVNVTALPWLRAFLYFHERILQRLALPDPARQPLRLPFWPWENWHATPSRRTPVIFTARPVMPELTKEEVDVQPALALRSAGDFTGAVLSGAAANVETRGGLTPVQPVFYAHLANVDRLAASWRELAGGRQGLDGGRATAQFFDEDGRWRSVSLRDFALPERGGAVYTSLMKPLALGEDELRPVPLSFGTLEDTQERQFLLVRGVRMRPGRFAVLHEERPLAVFTVATGGVMTLSVPIGSVTQRQARLYVAPLGADGRVNGNRMPLESREAFVF